MSKKIQNNPLTRTNIYLNKKEWNKFRRACNEKPDSLKRSAMIRLFIHWFNRISKTKQDKFKIKIRRIK